MKAALWGSLAGVAIVLFVVIPTALYFSHPEKFGPAGAAAAPRYDNINDIFRKLDQGGVMCVGMASRGLEEGEELESVSCELPARSAYKAIRYRDHEAVLRERAKFEANGRRMNDETFYAAEVTGENYRVLVVGYLKDATATQLKRVHEILGGSVYYYRW